MTNEQLYTILGVQAFNLLIVLWMINRSERNMNKRIDDLRDAINKRFDDLKDLLKSEIKRLEDKITSSRLV